ILGNTQQYWIIDDATRFVAQHYIACPHGWNLGCITGNDKVYKCFSIRAFDLDLAFNGDIPQRHMVDQCFVFSRGAAILKPDETPGMVSVVINRCSPAASLHRQMPIGRFAYPRVYQHFYWSWAGLTQIKRNVAVRLVNRGDVSVTVRCDIGDYGAYRSTMREN